MAPTRVLVGPFLLASLTFAQEPEAAGPGLLPEPRLRIHFGYGSGNQQHRTHGSDLDDRTAAHWFQLGVEGFGDQDFGGGLRIAGTVSDDDLFAAPGPEPTESTLGELFLYACGRFPGERFLVPVRFGLLVSTLEHEGQVTGGRIDFGTVGFQVEAEPQWRFVHTAGANVALFAAASLGLGLTEIETEPATSTWESTTLLLGAGAGVRARFDHFELGIGYVHRWQQMAESDEHGGAVVLGHDDTVRGVEIVLGIVF